MAKTVYHLTLRRHTHSTHMSAVCVLSQGQMRQSLPRRQMRQGERWGAGVETHKNVRGEIGGWGRVPFNETYAPSLSTIYDGA